MNIKDMIKNKSVTFEHYFDGELWYKTDCGFLFPVPISDIGNATFLKSDKAILFMKWIKKHLDLTDKKEI